MSKSLAGFAVAPLAPSVLLIIISMIRGPRGGDDWFILIVLVTSYLGSLIVGLPVHLLLKKLCYNSLPIYIAAGFVGGIVPFIILFGYPMVMNYGASPSSMGFTRGDYYILGIMAFCGGLIAGIFWLVARPGQISSRRTMSDGS
jgi:hypothetical protein